MIFLFHIYDFVLHKEYYVACIKSLLSLCCYLILMLIYNIYSNRIKHILIPENNSPLCRLLVSFPAGFLSVQSQWMRGCRHHCVWWWWGGLSLILTLLVPEPQCSRGTGSISWLLMPWLSVKKHKYEFIKWAIIGLDNGLLLVWCQAIIPSSTGIFVYGSLGNIFQ